MKKIINTLVMMILTVTLFGCSNESSSKPPVTTGNNTVQSIIDQQIKETEEDSTETQTTDIATDINTEESETEPIDNNIVYDVDLTELSSTMVYSEVFNMMNEPETYVGKSVRMNGQFALYQLIGSDGKPVPDQIYFACVIADATACCSQGLEFVLAGEHIYPDDYPELGSDIVVSGIFESYEENGYMFYHLVDAVFE